MAVFRQLGFLYVLVVGSTRDVVESADTWPPREFRAAWIATVTNIDWPLSPFNTTDQQKQDLVLLLDKLHGINFNAIVFQIRPAGDALYNSTIEPWSEYLTGTQGRRPSPYYDPLAFVIQEAHARNMEVHAWFNPYRARSSNSSRVGLVPSHMANRFPQFAYPYGKDLWMDPGAKEVQDQCYDVILDVVKHYDIDGVHMDDYYYPYPVAGVPFPDNITYNNYTQHGGQMDRGDWRRENVNNLITRIYWGIKNTKRYVKFGLSPFGIWKDGYPPGIVGLTCYDDLYADSRKWFSEGKVDYFSPQLYWRIDPPQQSFTHLMDWWLQQDDSHRHFYAGSYAGNVVKQRWPLSEIRRQVDASRKRRQYLSLGNVFFSAKNFRENSANLSTMFMEDLYTTPALAPFMSWLRSTPPPPPSGITYSESTLSWEKDSSNRTRSWALYKSNGGIWSLISVLNKDTTSKTVDHGTYAITAVDRLSSESKAVIIDT